MSKIIDWLWCLTTGSDPNAIYLDTQKIYGLEEPLFDGHARSSVRKLPCQVGNHL